MTKHQRIVLTGGPGGGKTTAADLLRRELGSRVVIVPEAATILFAGGFPRSQQWVANRAAQSAIETAAVAGLSIEGGNPGRSESPSEAVALDLRLRALWSRHPRFTLIEHASSFVQKLLSALAVVQRLVDGVAE